MLGDGSPDADGIQYRLTTPELSTTWGDGQSPSGTCATGSTYDDGELLVSQLILKAEPTTAGASGSFVDMNGDGCSRAGAGSLRRVATSPAVPPVRHLLERQVVALEIDPDVARQLGLDLGLALARLVDRRPDRRHVFLDILVGVAHRRVDLVRA